MSGAKTGHSAAGITGFDPVIERAVAAQMAHVSMAASYAHCEH